MSLTAAYIALATGVVVWFLLVRKLSTRSWESSTAPLQASATGFERFPPKRIGLFIFMAVITSLFGLFLSAYYMRMGSHGHGGAHGMGHDWVALSEPGTLWINTVVLILGSVAMQAARGTLARGQREQTLVALLLGGLFTLVFLAGQFFVWNEVSASPAFTPANPAVAFFYLLTAVHGLHLLGGLYVWGRTLVRMRKPDVELVDIALSVELCSVYWHYLLLVWLAVFAVLLST